VFTSFENLSSERTSSVGSSEALGSDLGLCSSPTSSSSKLCRLTKEESALSQKIASRGTLAIFTKQYEVFCKRGHPPLKMLPFSSPARRWYLDGVYFNDAEGLDAYL
jgi:hypothetical protein